jgi:hypothetical protein
MGLARIAIAVLAVVVAFGLLVIGGIALWGALTDKDAKPGAASPSSSSTGNSQPAASRSQVGNTIVIHCLAVRCPVFVSGPGPNDVQFNGNLSQNERRIFNETRLTVAVQDAGTVSVTINGRLQPRGRRGEAKTYEVPASQ